MRTLYKVVIPLLLTAVLIFDLLPLPNIKLSFLCKDPKLSHVYTGDTVTSKNLLLGATLLPLLIISLVEALKEKSFKNLNRPTIWFLYKKCLIGSACVILLTECVKSFIKEPRPHFFHSCKPDTLEDCDGDDLFLEYNCLNDELGRFYKNDLVRSFPSGHTSLSVYVALYCSYLIQVRIPSNSMRSLLKPFLIVLCLSWSLMCSLSRISDKRHHWWDVLGGAVLGVGSGIYTYFLYKKENTKVDLNKKEFSEGHLLVDNT